MIDEGEYEALRQRMVHSLFDQMASQCVGTVAVDREARIVWMHEKYKQLVGIAGDVRGKPVEEVIPNSQMRHVVETGKAMFLDIMQFGERSLVVTRLPMRDEAGAVIGAIAFAMYESAEELKPLIAKYQRLHEELSRTRQELSKARRAKFTFTQIVGSGESIKEVKRLARRAAQMDSTVLLLGETGTGKELLAHAIHAASPRVNKPFVAINAAAIPETLLEGELFGAAAGAYTGADRRGREGKFQIADGGTLFLDEIGDMPLALQAKLLRVLQEREIEPLGSNKVIRVDVRIVAATSRDLGALVKQNQFRADLYYRLNVVPIRLPPLRERLEDVEDIASSILEDMAIQRGTPPRELTEPAVRALTSYDWPGNVRELYNMLERVVAVTDEPVLTADIIRRVLPKAPGAEAPAAVAGGVRPLDDVVKEVERAAILAALKEAGGMKTKAAQLLGISRASLYERMATHGLNGSEASSG
ncbi:MAG TPA: sigma 54-interacting transcriptional regulator [Azospirillum sp.]|nr:sigma 54-interacting transcriptional regulator [Azospirillum sp.]